MPLRLVHVGLGAWGRSWARSVLPGAPDVEVVAWVDPDPAARRQVRELVGAPAERCYSGLDEALAAHPADAVLATTAIPAHTPVALAALRAGLHVLLEKPFAPTVAEAAQVVAEAEERGLVLAICQNYRFRGGRAGGVRGRDRRLVQRQPHEHRRGDRLGGRVAPRVRAR